MVKYSSMFKKKYVGIIGLVLVAVLALVSFLLGQYVMQRSIAKSEKRTEEASENKVSELPPVKAHPNCFQF